MRTMEFALASKEKERVDGQTHSSLLCRSVLIPMFLTYMLTQFINIVKFPDKSHILGDVDVHLLFLIP